MYKKYFDFIMLTEERVDCSMYFSPEKHKILASAQKCKEGSEFRPLK